MKVEFNVLFTLNNILVAGCITVSTTGMLKQSHICLF